jgi:hypothetical protein
MDSGKALPLKTSEIADSKTSVTEKSKIKIL